MTDEGLTEIVGKLEKLPAVDGVETYQAVDRGLARLVRGGVAASAVLAVIVSVGARGRGRPCGSVPSGGAPRSRC